MSLYLYSSIWSAPVLPQSHVRRRCPWFALQASIIITDLDFISLLQQQITNLVHKKLLVSNLFPILTFILIHLHWISCVCDNFCHRFWLYCSLQSWQGFSSCWMLCWLVWWYFVNQNGIIRTPQNICVIIWSHHSVGWWLWWMSDTSSCTRGKPWWPWIRSAKCLFVKRILQRWHRLGHWMWKVFAVTLRVGKQSWPWILVDLDKFWTVWKLGLVVWQLPRGKRRRLLLLARLLERRKSSRFDVVGLNWWKWDFLIL